MKTCPSCQGSGWRTKDKRPSHVANEPSSPCPWCNNGYITERNERILARLLFLGSTKYTAEQIAEGIMQGEHRLNDIMAEA